MEPEPLGRAISKNAKQRQTWRHTHARTHHGSVTTSGRSQPARLCLFLEGGVGVPPAHNQLRPPLVREVGLVRTRGTFSPTRSFVSTEDVFVPKTDAAAGGGPPAAVAGRMLRPCPLPAAAAGGGPPDAPAGAEPLDWCPATDSAWDLLGHQSHYIVGASEADAVATAIAALVPASVLAAGAPASGRPTNTDAVKTSPDIVGASEADAVATAIAALVPASVLAAGAPASGRPTNTDAVETAEGPVSSSPAAPTDVVAEIDAVGLAAEVRSPAAFKDGFNLSLVAVSKTLNMFLLMGTRSIPLDFAKEHLLPAPGGREGAPEGPKPAPSTIQIWISIRP